MVRSASAEEIIRTGDRLFAEGRGLDAVRLVLEVTAHHMNDWRVSLAGADVILRHTVSYNIVETLLRNARRCHPDHIQTQALLAHVLMAGGDIAGGCALFSEMMQRYPDERGTICEHMSMSFLDTGYPAESLQILLSHLETARPTVAMLNNVACSLHRLNRSAEAVSWYEQALALDPARPEIRFGQACSLLKAGRLREGWPLFFDRILSVRNGAAWFLSLPRLRPGDEVAGRRIILFYEQGLGDAIQFIRFVPGLVAKGAEVTILVPQPLVRLLAQSYPAASVREIDGFGREDGYDYAVPIPDLPYIAGVLSMHDIPAPIPYLRADSGDVARFAALLPARRPRIGLVWAGETRTRSEHVLADRRRSTTLAAMGEALTPVEATLVNLQFGAPRGEIAGWRGQAVCDLMGDVRDLADTAAIMANLDLVISVDTSPLHLAGAVGCPVWLVSRWDACWRWENSGDRSPWYPGMRIFRAQERSFVPVLQQVGAALRKWVACRQPGDGHGAESGGWQA
ncbi:glycosyltransferase family protein [Gluconacetobacter takamatsuzukensis]|uniref:Glycosyltransferase family protein n=1 Tax=Gluconacetobacter takamatsuzukensis TaxID=1286190 RepID=A0A7W4KB04_9PROT|nr:glycosyltransferase family protein [Gluconacetobacter takamatsuzukensis]